MSHQFPGIPEDLKAKRRNLMHVYSEGEFKKMETSLEHRVNRVKPGHLQWRILQIRKIYTPERIIPEAVTSVDYGCSEFYSTREGRMAD